MPNHRAKHLKFLETSGSGDTAMLMVELFEEFALSNDQFTKLEKVRDLVLEQIIYAQPGLHPDEHTTNLAERSKYTGQLELLDGILTNCNLLEN